MKNAYVLWIGVLLILTGCSTSRVLDQPLKSGGNDMALILYAGDPSKLIECGENGYHQMTYLSFYDWFFEAFEMHYQGQGVYVFQREAVQKMAARHGINPLCGYIKNVPGTLLYPQPYYFSFRDEDLDRLFDAAEELGATHIVKAESVDFKQQKGRFEREKSDPLTGSYLRTSSDRTRFDADVRVTVFSVHRREMLFQRTFSASDESLLFGQHNLKKSITAAIVKAIVSAEASSAGYAAPAASVGGITLQGGFEIPEWCPNGVPTRSKILYPTILDVARIGPEVLCVDLSLQNTTEYPLEIRFDQNRIDRRVMHLKADDGSRFPLCNDELLRNGLQLRPGERVTSRLIFNCPDTYSSCFSMEGDVDFSVPHYRSEVQLKFKNIPNRQLNPVEGHQ